MISGLKATHNRGILLLIVTTVIWGTSFPLLKQAMQDLPAEVILAARFTIAALAFLPWLRQLDRALIRDGALLGCLYFGECAAVLVGLASISANRSAFIVSLNVILVPIFAALMGQRLPVRMVWTAGLAIAGIGILCWDGGGVSWGDGLTLGCAIGVALYILTLEVVAPRHPTLPLVAVQLTVMALLSLVWAAPHW
ncbi:MAG: DMT family transporter [Pseudanabaena sp. CRU_2_10]|nr:DMT family transporter [Pseudanabaena sp. CRU_2_10]